MTNTLSTWDFLGQDLTELILSYLPIPSIIRASSVCKLWNSTIHSHSFKTRISNSRKSPWIFISGQNNNFSNNNHQIFAFDPESDYWFKLLDTTDSFTASDGYLFATCSVKFSFKQVFDKTWSQTSPSRFSRRNPLIGVCNEYPGCLFVVAGGFRSDIEACLAVEICKPDNNCWEICPHLPEIFRPGNSSKSLCSATFNRKFYVHDINSSFVTSFDLEKCYWSDVRRLRPPGVIFSYLNTCRDRLVLAGLCSVGDELEFNLWEIDETTLEFREIGVMPPDLLSDFLDNEGDLDFTSLKCVSSINFVCVFNQRRRRSNRFFACVCEISDSGKCSWKRVLNLPEHVNELDKIVVSAFVPMYPF